MGNAFNGIFQGVSEIIHWIDAPLIASAVMGHMVDAVDDRIAHIEVWRGQVDLGAQRHCSVVKFSSPHSGKQIKIFLNRPVPIRAGRWVGKIAAHTFEFIGRKFTDIG